MQQSRELDFLVIGAAKSATTTLFELARHHPEIYMPAAKEVAFFSDDTVYTKGWDWYVKTYIKRQDNKKVAGTVTPQYMNGDGQITPDVIAQRISQQLPDVKLIAVLRHPIQRAFSHYKMSYRQGYITDSFEDAVKKLLLEGDLQKERNNLNPSNTFLLSSEYGRILSPYFKMFSKNKILILYAEDFKSNPHKTMKEVFNFLEVDDSFTPKDIGKNYHKGGSKPKTKLLTPAFLYRIPFVKNIWQRFIPHSIQKYVNRKINNWNIQPDNSTLSRNDPTYEMLREHYTSEVAELNKFTGRKSVWDDWG